MKRVVAYIGKVLLAGLLLVLLLVTLCYLPPVQRYLKDQAIDYLAEEHQLHLELQEFRLAFPLKLSLKQLYCGNTPQDTLIALKSLQIQLGLNKLFQQEWGIEKLNLQGGRLNWRDSSGLWMEATLGNLHLQANRINLKKRQVEIQQIACWDGKVKFFAGNSPATPVDTTASIDWTFEIEQVDLQRLSYEMKLPDGLELRTGVQTGHLAEIAVDLGQQLVGLDSLKLEGGYAVLTLATAETPEESIGENRDSIPERPWTVKAGCVQVANSAFSMGDERQKTVEWMLSGIGIQLDSIYNRGEVVKARLTDFQAVQPNGITLQTVQAEIGLDTTSTWVSGGFLRTLHSRLQMELHADSNLEQLMQQEPLTFCLEGVIGMADVLPFYADLPVEIQQKQVQINAALSIQQKRFQIGQLIVEMPKHFKLTGSGHLSDYHDYRKWTGRLGLRCEMPDISFANSFLKEWGIELPQKMDLLVKLQAEQGNLDGFLRCCQEQGCLSLDLNYISQQARYEVEMDANRFPLAFLGKKNELGELSTTLHLRGTGVEWGKIGGELSMQLKQLGFRGHQYRNISLNAELVGQRLSGTLLSKDTDLPLSLNVEADSTEEGYRLHMKGSIGRLDLHRLQWVEEPLAFKTELALQGVLRDSQQGKLQLELDHLQMWEAHRHHLLGDLKLEGESSQGATRLHLASGDMELQFRSDTSSLALVDRLNRVGELVFTQLKELNIDMEAVRQELPAFSLRIQGEQENAIMRFLATKGIGFDRLKFFAVSRKQSGIRLRVLADAPYWDEIQLDSLQLGAWQTGKSLSYSMTAGSSSEEWKGVFNLYLTGRLQGDRFRVELKQQDTQGKIGFDWGINVVLGDTATTLRFFPTNPILGYNRWTLNPDNRLVIWPEGKLWSNLKMEGRGKWIRFQSLGDQDHLKNRLQVQMAGIDLAALSERTPFVPQLSGILGMNLLLYHRQQEVGMHGNLQVADLEYEQFRMGDVDLKLDYQAADTFANHALQAELMLDSIRRIWTRGTLETKAGEQKLDLAVEIPSLPLALANAFVPQDMMQLGGEIVGKMQVRGSVDRPRLDGYLRFQEGVVDAVLLGTRFQMDTARIPIVDSRMEWKEYELRAIDRSRLVLSGSMVLTPLDQMSMNLSLIGRNFEWMNVKKKKSSLIYGKAYANIQTEVKGSWSDLNASGKIQLLNRSDITYVMQSSELEVENRNTDFIRFISFQDTTSWKQQEVIPQLDVRHFAMRMLIEIGEQVNLGVELSASGNDQIALQGGGNLIFQINPESGMTLSGKYLLSKGSVVYNVPVVGKKEFSIRNGSFVEWTSNIMNPTLNIVASSQVKADVEEGDRTRQAIFEAMIRIQNNLSRPNITFDLSAPNDLVIQNQLSTFSAEERTRQALNLLIYNTYTAPGAAKSAGGEQFANHAIYSFVENELNKYTRKAGLTVGFDSHQTDNTIRTDVTYQFSRQLFNDRMRVKIGGRVSTDGDEEQNGNQLQDNLVDDISIEYALTKRRNFYVKVFRQANYESVLDGEVIQTGGGIVWRKSFRTLKDLFKSKKRVERKAEKMEKQEEKEKYEK